MHHIAHAGSLRRSARSIAQRFAQLRSVRILEGTTGELTAVRVVFDAAEEAEIRERFETLFPGVRLVTVESPFRAIVVADLSLPRRDRG